MECGDEEGDFFPSADDIIAEITAFLSQRGDELCSTEGGVVGRSNYSNAFCCFDSSFVDSGIFENDDMNEDHRDNLSKADKHLITNIPVETSKLSDNELIELATELQRFVTRASNTLVQSLRNQDSLEYSLGACNEFFELTSRLRQERNFARITSDHRNPTADVLFTTIPFCSANILTTKSITSVNGVLRSLLKRNNADFPKVLTAYVLAVLRTLNGGGDNDEVVL